jgi:hypothetical protein
LNTQLISVVRRAEGLFALLSVPEIDGYFRTVERPLAGVADDVCPPRAVLIERWSALAARDLRRAREAAHAVASMTAISPSAWRPGPHVVREALRMIGGRSEARVDWRAALCDPTVESRLTGERPPRLRRFAAEGAALAGDSSSRRTLAAHWWALGLEVETGLREQVVGPARPSPPAHGPGLDRAAA